MSDRQAIIATVDIALFTLVAGQLSLVLVKRKFAPHKGRLSLPGGYIHIEEDADAVVTARRVLKQKTGLRSPYLEQLYTFSGAARDPRGWSITICYYALVSEVALAEQGSGDYELVAVDELPALPFDHDMIVATALDRLRGKSTYSTLPAFLLPETFTYAELRNVYEQVIGTRLNKDSFRRKIEALNFIEKAPGRREELANRPAELYRLRALGVTSFDRKI